MKGSPCIVPSGVEQVRMVEQPPKLAVYRSLRSTIPRQGSGPVGSAWRVMSKPKARKVGPIQRCLKFDDFLLKLGEISDDRYIARLVRHVSRRNLEPHEVASLAIKIADSGFSLPASASAAADIPSTGGPSSLSTLVCPLFLNSKGFTVPKLGIPGRPAGGIDVLGTIPGYKTNLSYEDVLQCLKECQYAYFVAGGAFVPLDLRIFRVRQEAGAQDNPYLVAASLIAKKLAASVTHVRLDVRVGPHGNFGRTLEEARSNAMMFNTVARIVGLDSGCYLSDARAVYQPFIGRGEALVALDDLFNDRASLWLKEHIQNCWEMTKHLWSFMLQDPRQVKCVTYSLLILRLKALALRISMFGSGTSERRTKLLFEHVHLVTCKSTLQCCGIP